MNWIDFIKFVNDMKVPRILELGTKRVNSKVSTMRKNEFAGYSQYIGIDLEAGEDVDIVGDIHKLSKIVGKESFDVIISIVTFEHLKYPFLAAHEIMKTLKIGGCLFLNTVQTFPLHNFPNDYFRFSTEALESLFGSRNGFRINDIWYENKVDVHNMEGNQIAGGQSWRSSFLVGSKLFKTPDRFIYEFEYT